MTEDVPADWLATGTCDDGTVVDGGRVDVDLDAGDDVTCTFHNTRRVSLTVTKDAVPNSTQDFAFSVALDRAAPVPFALDDDGTETDGPEMGQLVSTISGPHLVPGRYTVTESPVEGWRLADLDCTGGQVEEEDPLTGRAVVRLSAGQSAQCVYRNEQQIAPTTTPPPTSTTASDDRACLSDRGHPRCGAGARPRQPEPDRPQRAAPDPPGRHGAHPRRSRADPRRTKEARTTQVRGGTAPVRG